MSAPLCAAAIAAASEGALRSEQVHVLAAVDSTNAWLMQRGVAQSTLCIAERQWAGRGRRGRQWLSPAAGFTASLGLLLPLPSHRVGAFSLVAALALAEAIETLGTPPVALKWPNDLLHGGGKLAGLLLEVASAERERTALVIGAGVNCAAPPGALDRAVSDLGSLCGGRAPDRNLLAGRWAARLCAAVPAFVEHGFAAHRATWASRDALHGAPVRVHDSGGACRDALACGVGDDGRLRVRTDAGERWLNAGEVSLRPASG